MNDLLKLYSSAEDYSNPLVDQYNRPRYFTSRNPDIFSPLLSEEIYSRGFRPYYPGHKSFAFCLSHDIDLLYLRRPLYQRVRSLAGRSTYRTGEQLAYVYSSLLKERVYPHYSLQKLEAINKSWNMRSTYFFLALKGGETDHNYDLGSVREDVQELKERGNEIGLHGGHEAYNNLGKLMQEKELFEAATGTRPVGYRNHYLRFEMGKTWNILQEAGFQYDTTYGYPDCSGFRNGMCYPFYPYDLKGERYLDIVEMPLIVMDATLFYYMRFSDLQIKELIRSMLQKVKAVGGVFTLLWHNNNISGNYLTLYQEVLEMITREDPWIATTSEAVSWWEEKGLLAEGRKALNGVFGIGE